MKYKLRYHTLTICYKLLLVPVVCLFTQAVCQAQSEIAITGHVADADGKPVVFASVKIEESQGGTYTNEKGGFRIPVPAKLFDSVTLSVSYVNKATVTRVIHKQDYVKPVTVQLHDQSLTLDDVQVLAVRQNKNSSSSIIFDREAILQSQAFSLADILTALPGKTTQAPNLQQPQALTLRTAAGGINALNNSFGIAIYVDGVRINNDGDIQARSLAVRGMVNSGISSHTEGGSGYDVTYGGPDLRNISLENVESIEVIQGIADARYGELTNGAILITTRAGRTPIHIAMNMNGGSTQVTGSKGFQLKGKAGAINLSAGYTNSNKDPRDKIKSYNRVNTSMKWTIDISKRLRNTLSLSYNTKLDDVKMDPDDDSEQRTFQKEHSVSVSNRTMWQSQKGFIRTVDLNTGFSRGRQESFSQWLLNGPPFGIADKDTTGVYEGFFVPGNYLAEEHILGLPVSINANLDIRSRMFFTGPLRHRLSGGITFSSSGNRGPGTIHDPHKPRWQGSNIKYRSERPIDRSLTLPFLSNQGYYVQDNISGQINNKAYTVNLGFRADVQNGYLSYQPRLGVGYTLNPQWGINVSYGISTKAPSLAVRYPVPSWIDIPVLQLYNGYADESLFLVYTQKTIADNSYLKASKNASVELGLTFKNKWSNGSLYFYMKKNTAGFNSRTTPTPLSVPKYDYEIGDDGRIVYFPTGEDMLLAETRITATNGLFTADYGAEMMFATKEIAAISTGFSATAGFTYSIYDNRFDTIYAAVNADMVNQGKPALYGVYKPVKNSSYSLVTTLSSVTHIPKIGFTFTVSADLKLLSYVHREAGERDPMGYLNRAFEYVAINSDKVANPEYDYLRRPQQTESIISENRIIFPAIHVTIAKEIRKKMRLMLKGYNMFNIRPEYINPVTKAVQVFNEPVSLSAGITIQL